MPYTSTCINCGKEFTSKNKGRKFCSHSCSALFQGKNGKTYFQQEDIVRVPWNKRNNPYKTCEHCGCLFFASSSSIKYCSRKCYAEHIRKEKRGRIYLCENCGKEFYSRSGYKNNTPKFCSQECSRQYHKANYKKKEYHLTCKECGKEFVVGSNEQNHQFCSKECAYKNHTFYKKGKRVRTRLAARARREALTIPIDEKFMTALLIAQRGRCVYCNQSLKHSRTIEYLLPVCKGGNNHKYNLVWVCKKCNSQKGALTISEYMDKYEKWWLVDLLDEVFAEAMLIESKIKQLKKKKNG